MDEGEGSHRFCENICWLVSCAFMDYLYLYLYVYERLAYWRVLTFLYDVIDAELREIPLIVLQT